MFVSQHEQKIHVFMLKLVLYVTSTSFCMCYFYEYIFKLFLKTERSPGLPGVRVHRFTRAWPKSKWRTAARLSGAAFLQARGVGLGLKPESGPRNLTSSPRSSVLKGWIQFGQVFVPPLTDGAARARDPFRKADLIEHRNQDGSRFQREPNIKHSFHSFLPASTWSLIKVKYLKRN